MVALRGLGSGLQPWCPLDLSLEWVDTVWELDFTETEPLDPSIESEIIETGLSAFTKLHESLFPFATEEHGSTETIWTFFIENSISHSTLVALFYHFVQIVHKKNVSVQYREYGLHAAGLYFLLLEVPGSVANQVFHPVMFDKCIQTLKKSWPQESNLNRKRKKEQPMSSQANPRRHRKRGKPPRKEDIEMDEIIEQEDEENIYFSARDLSQIRNAIFHVLKNFLRLLPKFSLKEKPQCVQNCIEVFVTLTNFEPVLHECRITQIRDLNQAKYIPELAYHGLYLLCSPFHGEGDKVISYVFHQMLNVILMLEAGEGSHRTPLTITSQVINQRNQAVQFISSLVDELRESVFPVLRVLLQHICAKVIDKSEYRTSAAQALVQLLSKLPCREYATFIAWLYKYSRSSKIPHRVFTLDVVLAVLELPERQTDDTVSLEHQKFLKHKFLVQEIMFDRCLDKAPTVRSKALSSFAHCLELTVTNASESILELLINSPAVSGIESHPGTLLRNSSAFSYQRQTVNPSEPSEDVNIDSGGETVGSGERCVMAMLRKRIRDEKTNVRKSALQVLVSILKHCEVSYMKEDLSILQDRCRDPAVSVRKQALQSLTELLMAQPRCVHIQKAWLRGVVPVVMDCESTVQEKALECLDQVLLQNIRHHSKFHTGDDSQVLAWALLALLTTESRGLSRYLNKAFHIWSKKDKFSPTFISNVISHTGMGHSAPAWMLLSKIACSSPKLDYTKIIESWEKISSFGEFCLAHLLLKRNPVMFFQHFIECIFHFNNYEKHEKYNKFPQSEREKRLFSLKGKSNKERRMKIYKFLLEHFTDEQRFNITSKICLSILACFADGILPLDLEASELLSDTFEVLSSKEIKLLAMRSKPDKDLLVEEDDMALANVVMQEAQKQLISQVQKRNFIENIIPIIISLKTVLEKNKIPALRELMNYLREVMQDYRDEVKDFFAVDKQLASELEYDMKKYNEQLAQEQELAKQANVSRVAEGTDAAPAVQVAPHLEIMPVPAGQENPTVSQPSAPGPSTGRAPTLSPVPETGPLNRLMSKARPMSLSTIAILNSVRKAVESNRRHRSRSLGVLPFTLNSGSPEKPCNRASSYSLEQESNGAIDHVTKRAISTPEQTINDVTFGAGVSYIGTPRTPSVKEKTEVQSQGNDILCLSLPDKPPPQPQQWNVKSPARNKNTPTPSRRSLRKTPLKTAN
ncbi:condensin-2 complex subunit D3 isoform X4 [Lemur catta]|uniref:condensin-2 complex subunit D3 isoform X4 n=1 Tax=Lemur catta TaxID=9447 RepID=UPI001E26711F|nr:condensin-2 complex subunit D3 isoform X4 [Lemur catta]